MRKVIFYLLGVLAVVAVVVAMIVIVNSNRKQIEYELIDTINVGTNIEGLTVCSKKDKHYYIYGLDKYNIDFDTYSILITSTNVTRIINYKKGFIKVYAERKTDGKTNIYALNSSNLHFDVRDSINNYILFDR